MLGAAAAGAVVLMALAAVLTRSRRRRGSVSVASELPAGANAPPALDAAADSEEVRQMMASRLADQAAQKERLEAEALAALKLPAPTTKKAEVLRKHLTETAKKDPAATAQVLRTWLYESEE